MQIRVRNILLLAMLCWGFAWSSTHALEGGNLELVKALAAKEGAPIVTVTYHTASGSFMAGQIFHYVPYEYEPLSKVYIRTAERN